MLDFWERQWIFQKDTFGIGCCLRDSASRKKKLMKVYKEGKKKLRQEFDVEYIVKQIRNMHTYLKSNSITASSLNSQDCSKNLIVLDSSDEDIKVPNVETTEPIQLGP